MAKNLGNTSGKCLLKSGFSCKVRLVILTDVAWYSLVSLAYKAGMSLNEYIETLPELEAIRDENQWLHKQLGNSTSEKESLKQELMEVRSQLAIERSNLQKFEKELSELKQNLCPREE